MLNQVDGSNGNGCGVNASSEVKSGTEGSERKNDTADNTFRTLNPGERDSQQPIGARSAKSNTPDGVHMTQQEDEGGSVLEKFLALSISNDLSSTERLQTALSKMSDLMGGSTDTSGERKEQLFLCMGILNSMISDEFSQNNHNQIGEFYSKAKVIDFWISEGGGVEKWNKFGLQFNSIKLSSSIPGTDVEIPFYDYIHGLSEAEIMKDMKNILNNFQFYLEGCDVRHDDTFLLGRAMQGGSPELVLVNRLTDLKSKEYSDFQIHLDGDSSHGVSYFEKNLMIT